MHAWEAPTEEVTQAITKVSTGGDDDRPDPPDIEGECEIGDCTAEAAAQVYSTDETVGDEWFLFCEDCTAIQTDRYDDLEVAD